MMANRLKGEIALPKVDVVGFEKGGTLLLDFNALCTLEGELQGHIEEVGLAVLQSPRAMRKVMQAALEEHHGAVDERTAGKVIQALGMEKAGELIQQTFLLSFPEAAEGNADPRPTAATAAAGTSRSATASGSKSAKRKKPSGR